MYVCLIKDEKSQQDYPKTDSKPVYNEKYLKTKIKS